jgi:hypothetical protein
MQQQPQQRIYRVPHIQGWNTVRGCVSITCAARASEFGQEEVEVRVSRGGVYGVNPPLALLIIFIEHINGLPRYRLITILIRLE